MFRLGVSTTLNPSHRSLPDRIRVAAYAAMAYWFYRWDWGESVAVDGLARAGRALDDRAFSDFVDCELERWVAQSRTTGSPNPIGPAVALLDAVGEQRMADESAARECLDRLAERLHNEQPDSRGCAPERDRQLLFVDLLYGLPAFLAGYRQLVDDPAITVAAVARTVEHCRILQSSSGLFGHFADLDSSETPHIAWGRGNGWAVLGLSDLLLAVPPEVPGMAEIRERFTALLDGLRATQSPGGLWRNVIDDPTSYPEASTTLFVVAAITQAVDAELVEAGYLALADEGWSALEHRIDVSGHVVGVSYRPGVNTDPARYEHTPVTGAYPWGQGPYLRAACQRLTHDARPLRDESP
ncbi:MAG: glycoside hydrolase family 88 protein [Nocardioidaceae bacterium]